MEWFGLEWSLKSLLTPCRGQGHFSLSRLPPALDTDGCPGVHFRDPTWSRDGIRDGIPHGAGWDQGWDPTRNRDGIRDGIQGWDPTRSRDGIRDGIPHGAALAAVMGARFVLLQHFPDTPPHSFKCIFLLIGLIRQGMKVYPKQDSQPKNGFSL